MKFPTLFAALVAAAPLAGVTLPAAAENGAPAALVAAASDIKTPDFVQKVAISDMFEVESGKLALERSKDPGVRKFAAEMVHDHTMTTNKLKETLAASHIDATPPTALDDAHQQLLQQLRDSSAADFDRDYMKIQVQGHEDALTLLQSYSESGDNDALKQVATKTIPMVKKHLAAAQKISLVSKQT